MISVGIPIRRRRIVAIIPAVIRISLSLPETAIVVAVGVKVFGVVSIIKMDNEFTYYVQYAHICHVSYNYITAGVG